MGASLNIRGTPESSPTKVSIMLRSYRRSRRLQPTENVPAPYLFAVGVPTDRRLLTRRIRSWRPHSSRFEWPASRRPCKAQWRGVMPRAKPGKRRVTEQGWLHASCAAFARQSCFRNPGIPLGHGENRLNLHHERALPYARAAFSARGKSPGHAGERDDRPE
jgi:hypothetical protein